jgi:hypothetical protein
MKYKKSILASLLLGSLCATSANASLSCEYIGDGNSICEAIVSNPQENSYAWTTTGNASVSSNGFAFASGHCSGGGFPGCQIQVTVTYPNGSTSNWSSYLPASTPGIGAGGGGGAWHGNGTSCLGTNICPDPE